MTTVAEVPVEGYERYSIRTDGQLRLISGRLTHGHGLAHKRATLCGEGGRSTLCVHRLVARAFVPNPRPDLFLEVDHIDRNPQNNRATNLRWLTRQLNMLNNDGRACSYHRLSRKWQARLVLNSKFISHGYYDTYQEAHAVGVKARQEAFARIYSKLCANDDDDPTA